MGPESKNTYCADGASFILNSTQTSFETLIDVLENFSNTSDLKLNSKNVMYYKLVLLTSGPKGNDAHLRAIINLEGFKMLNGSLLHSE